MARHRVRHGVRRGPLAAALALAVAATALSVDHLAEPGPMSRSPVHTDPPARADPRPGTDPPGRAASWARTTLARLDDARSRAWRDADPGALAAVYVDGSAVVARDRAVLRAYASRGLRVRHVHLDVLQVRVVSRTRTTARLIVVERLVGAVAVDARGRARALPRDHATRYALTLRTEQGRWQIASVTTPGDG